MIVTPPPVRWGIPDAVVVFLIMPLVIAAGIGYQLLGLPAEQGPATFVLGLAGYGLIVVAVVIISRRRGQRSLRADFGVAFKPVDLAIGLGVAVLGKIATLVIGIAVLVLGGQSPQSGNFMIGDDPVWIVLTAVLVGSLIAPIVEELAFRGVVLRAVRYRVLRGPRSAPHAQPVSTTRQGWSIAIAILVSSATFALLHLYQAPGDPALFAILALGTFTVGIFHGLITVVTGRLGPAMVSHIVFNGSSVVLQLLLADSLG